MPRPPARPRHHPDPSQFATSRTANKQKRREGTGSFVYRTASAGTMLTVIHRLLGDVADGSLLDDVLDQKSLHGLVLHNPRQGESTNKTTRVSLEWRSGDEIVIDGDGSAERKVKPSVLLASLVHAIATIHPSHSGRPCGNNTTSGAGRANVVQLWVLPGNRGLAPNHVRSVGRRGATGAGETSVTGENAPWGRRVSSCCSAQT